MKILWISKDGDGYSVSKFLADRGHDVDIWIWNNGCKDVGKGLDNPKPIQHSIPDEDKEGNHLKFEKIAPQAIKLLMPYVKKSDFIVFDMVGMGMMADYFHKFKPVLGGSMFADKIEEDREFAYKLMQKSTKCKVSEYHTFDSIKEGIKFLKTIKDDSLYVFKPFDDFNDKGLTYLAKDTNESLIEMMKTIDTDKFKYLLQKQVQGVEISTEGYFNGQRFVGAWNHTMERKRLCNGDIGPNTGSQGAVVWGCDADRLVRTTLLPLAPTLQRMGYCGPIDANVIVKGEEAYFLEFCGRMGYHGIELVLSLLEEDPGKFLYKIAKGMKFEPRISSDYAMAVRLSTIPLEGDPEDDKIWKDVKVLNIPKYLKPYLWLNYCYYDEKGDARMCGNDGMVGCTVVTAPTIEQCRALSYDIIEECKWTNDLIYRTDIGEDVKDKIKQLSEWL